MNNLTIKNLNLIQIKENDINPVFCDLRIESGKIIEIIPKDFKEFVFNHSENQKPAEDEYDAQGTVGLIPLINFHDHIYSRLAKGLAIKSSTDNFHKILKNLWWKLDRVLDYGMIRASAQMAVLESIRNGTTYIFDHHSSPDSAKGSLEIIANTFSEFNLRGTFCFEITDRNGNELKKEAIKENCEFIEKSNENFKGMIGLHASFTLKDSTLKLIGDLMNDYDTGIHIHLCEDKVDREISKKQFDASPLKRLLKFNLINSKSILAHGIHLKKKEYEMIAERGAAIALNPDSNMNNSVGIPTFKNLPENLKLLLGTDGMHSNIAKTFKQVFLLYRHSGGSFSEGIEFIKQIYFNQIEFVKNYFGNFSTLNLNENCDLVIWDYLPVNELTTDNFWGHFIYGITERYPRSVIQGGKFLMKDYIVGGVDFNYLKNIALQGLRLKENFELQ